MLRALPYIVLSIIVYMTLIYMQDYQPEELTDLIIKLDVLGITKVSKYEHFRENSIKRMSGIGAMEKEVLLKHTVFIGATAEMVEYALGVPKLLFKDPDGSKDKDGNNTRRIYYVYFLVGDKRPTVFEFACRTDNVELCKSPDNKSVFILSKAYKKSTIDFNIDASGDNEAANPNASR